MMKATKTLMSLILVIAAVWAVAPPQVSAFNLFSNCVTTSSGTQLCGPCKANPNTPACNQAGSQGTTDPIAGNGGIISKAAKFIAVIAGIGAVIMIIMGAFFYVTSGGDSTKVASARARMLSGLIGLAVIAGSWTIISFVTDKVIK